MQQMDLDVEWLTRSQLFRTKMLKGMSLVTLLAGLFYGSLNLLVLDQKMLGIFELCFSIYSAYLFCYADTFRHRPLHPILYVAAISAIIFFAVSTTPTSVTVFVWMFISPIIAYLLLGKSNGFRINLFLIPGGIANYTWQILQPDSILAINSAANVAVCLVALWAVAHVYERNREVTERQLTSLATLDPLTQIDNRLSLALGFEKMVTMHRRKTDVFSLLVIDLDYFKAINDEFGHDTGDQVLVKVANLLAETARLSDTVYRVGGEEFCVLLPYTDRQKGRAMAEHLRKVIARHCFEIDGQCINVSASIGISEYGEDGMALDDMFKTADGLLYKAKDLGRNQVAYAIT